MLVSARREARGLSAERSGRTGSRLDRRGRGAARVAGGEEQPCGPPSVGRKKAGPAPHSNHGVATSAVRKTSRVVADKGSRGRKEQRCGGEVGWGEEGSDSVVAWSGAGKLAGGKGRGARRWRAPCPARRRRNGAEHQWWGGGGSWLGCQAHDRFLRRSKLRGRMQSNTEC